MENILIKELNKKALEDVEQMIKDLNVLDEKALADLKAKSQDLNKKITEIKYLYPDY